MRTHQQHKDLGARAQFQRKNDDDEKITKEKILTGKDLTILSINENSCYYKYRNLLIGKQVRVLRVSDYGKWVEFVKDTDRQRLNIEAGWSDRKKEYLLDGVKLK